MTIGILHPGSMGSSVGAALRTAGNEVLWASSGRSPATLQRAEADGLTDAETLRQLTGAADVILSICPPEAALDLAQQTFDTGFTGTFVDANAVSPGTARKLSGLVSDAGARYVDGGIIGPPARKPDTTRLYLSGTGAGEIAALFDGGLLTAIPLAGAPESASALKMAYAGWTKGTSALLAATLALAEHEQVTAPLLQEWERLGLVSRAEGLGGPAAKAWRWVGEMEEIASAYASAGLPDGFHLAAAEVYRRLARFKDDPNAPGGTELAKTLLDPGS